ncbi:MAG: hypothetical protein A2W21_07865 [Betaproteobacteria bacterium RBG_16_66_20]|nr:MAG: hypothetical protein A2W21_07865 [Betaproteobacteria bacterium RBG_16_66_20]OHE89302.1 MAG: hypothetical protein A3G75_05680 [Verrucomicrobia bacterium RIFCSPLOWO2_12_FULL_64_8]
MNEPIHPVQLEALKRATPAQKLEAVAALYDTGIRLRMAGLRMTHPDWPDERLEHEARRSLRHAGT